MNLWPLMMVTPRYFTESTCFSSWPLGQLNAGVNLNTATVDTELDRVQPVVNTAAGLTDKPTRGQSSRGLDNLWTGQLANSKFLKITELLYFICTLNLTLTLSNIGHV